MKATEIISMKQSRDIVFTQTKTHKDTTREHRLEVRIHKAYLILIKILHTYQCHAPGWAVGRDSSLKLYLQVRGICNMLMVIPRVNNDGICASHG